MASKVIAKPQLLEKIVEGISFSSWQAFVLSRKHPFLIAIENGEESYRLRVHIWNCTHGGGTKRPQDEFRIQIKSALNDDQSAIRLLLGWHSGYQVFAGFDFERHKHQNPAESPSIQIKEATLVSAHNGDFAVYRRSKDEIAIAFQPILLCEYAVRSVGLHGFASNESDLQILEKVADDPSLPTNEIERTSSEPRATVLLTLKKKLRASNFSQRVLSAYNQRCAVCCVQLKLVEAAHILPVSAEGSTDETRNGIALCTLHHRAFDTGLIVLEENYRISVNQERAALLNAANLAAGLGEFARGLPNAIALPADRGLRPKVEFIRKSRGVRGA